MRHIIFASILIIVSINLFGQTTIWSEDFTNSSNYNVTLGGEGNDGSSDYFQITDGSNIGVSYTGNSGNFFAAQDIDDGGWSGSACPSQLTWTGINISGYTSLSFEGLFASAATSKIDDNDYVIIEVNIDGAGWVTILEFENDGTQYNTYFLEDTDFDGTGDGTQLTSTFANFTKNISGTGSSLDIRITVSVNSGGEDFAFDEFYIKGTVSTPSPELQVQIPTGTDVSCGDTYDYGIQTTGTSTDVTLTIKNTGNADLNISSYPLSGTDASEFSLSPASTSTTISAGNSYDITVTFSPTSAGNKSAKITINNDDSDEDPCEINLIAEAQDACTSPDQPTNLDLTTNTTTSSIDGSFTAPSPAADSYLIVYSTSNSLSSNPVDGTTYSPGDALGGGTVLDNITSTSFSATGLNSGTEYYFFIFANNNSNCTGGPVYNTTNPLSGSEITIPENPSWNDAGCITNSTIELSWNAATGNSTGYLLVVREGAVPHSVNGLDPSTNLGEDTDYSSAATFGSTTPNSRILYKGTGTSITITGLTQGTSYTFKLFTYTVGSSEYVYSSGTQQTNTINLPDVSSESATCSDSQSDIAWVNPSSSCFDEILVVANETSGIDFTPSGDGSSYSANTVYSAPNQVVYKGTGTNVTVTSLTNGTTYYFEIFTRKASEWSPGVEVSCTPNEITVLYPGDLAIVAVNTDIDGSGADEVCFFSFKDINNGTAIDFTDNGYERDHADEWGDTEGTIRLERSGSTIEKGTVICVQGHRHSSSDFTVFVCGSNDNSNWNVSSLNGNYDYDLNVDDQIWIMQNGNWSNPSGTHDATYDGNILYGWTATGWKASPGYNSTKGSTLYENAECFNTNVISTSDHDKVKFYSDTSQTLSQAAWIGEINSSSNWTGYSDNSAYDAGGLDYSGSCVKFKIDNSLGTGAGRWQGGEDNNWFNCANWLNMQVPDENVDVTILSNAQNEANIDDSQDDASTYGGIAKCKNLTVEDGGDTIYIKVNDNSDVLHVYGDMTLKKHSKVYNDNGGTIIVEGSIILNDSTLLDMHANTTAGANLKLYGDWKDNNETDNNSDLGFYETGSKVSFLGSTQQKIYDVTDTASFYDILMSNSAGLDLNGNDINVAGTLDLTQGKITTDSKKVIINNTSTSAVVNHSTSSYINGNLQRYVNSTGSYDFPVGSSSQYELANINLNSSTGITYFDSKFTNPVSTTDISALGLSVNGTSVPTLLDYGFWTITPDNYTAVDYDVTVTSRGHTNGGSSADQHTVVKREDASHDWATFEANHSNSTQSGTGNNPITAKLSHLNSFSDYAIARSTDFPLPVIYSYFKAELTGNNNVVLYWQTLSEINSAYFEVQKSVDSYNFVSIGKLIACGNCNFATNYKFEDNTLLNSGTVYYRLKQVDFDGKYYFSDIKAVEISNDKKITVYQNNSKIVINSNDISELILFDLSGKIITKTQSQNTLDISFVNKGVYILSVKTKNSVSTHKVVVP